ncbi:MAG: hypothetical protein AAGA69_01715 [Pseudomonadota bacterium]
MVVLRILAWILVALALMFLGHDAISFLEQGEPVVTTVAEFMDLLGMEVAMPENGAAKWFLQAPFSLLLGVPGLILTLVFRSPD